MCIYCIYIYMEWCRIRERKRIDWFGLRVFKNLRIKKGNKGAHWFNLQTNGLDPGDFSWLSMISFEPAVPRNVRQKVHMVCHMVCHCWNSMSHSLLLLFPHIKETVGPREIMSLTCWRALIDLQNLYCSSWQIWDFREWIHHSPHWWQCPGGK